MIWGRATWAVVPRRPRSPTSPTRITISPSFWSLHRVVTAPKLPMPLSQSLVERGETETLPPRQPVGDWAGMSRSKLLSQQQARRGGLIVVDRPTQQICISDIYYIHLSTDKHKTHRKVICWVDSCCNEHCLHLNKCKLQPCQGQVRIAKEATVTQQNTLIISRGDWQEPGDEAYTLCITQSNTIIFTTTTVAKVCQCFIKW